MLGAQAYISLEMFEEAVKDCDQAIQINPQFVKAYYRKAKAMYELVTLPGFE